MPLTLVHFGVALPVHAVTKPRQFSLWAFAATQVLIDLEPGVKLVAQHPGDLHNLTHNPAIGVIVGLVVAASLWRWFRWGAVTGAVYGVVTHLYLDAMYHVDVAAAMDRWGAQVLQDALPTGAEGICLFGFLLWLLMLVPVGAHRLWRRFYDA